MRMEEPSHSNLPSLAPELSQKSSPFRSLGDYENSLFSPSRESHPCLVFTDFVGTLLALLADQA